MSKIRIECPVCGSEYELTSQNIQKIDKDTIACYICNSTLLEYDGCTSWYPFLLNKKEKHLQPSFPFNDLLSGHATEPEA